jgi:thioesterase domain-containing protein
VVERGDYLLMLMQGAIHARPSDWWRYLSARWAMRRETKLIDSMARLHPDQLGRRELNRWILETRVMHQYRSEGYDGPITFFYPEESQYQLYGDPSCGWLYQARRVYLHKVPGSHLNMMKEPHVRKLAEKLMYCIRQATETAS